MKNNRFFHPNYLRLKRKKERKKSFQKFTFLDDDDMFPRRTFLSKKTFFKSQSYKKLVLKKTYVCEGNSPV